jgi:hypothetical protein
VSADVWNALEVLDPPLRLCPHHWSSWRHMLLFDHFRELVEVFQRRWRACWEGNRQVRELAIDGERFEWLTRKAMDFHEHDDLDRCEKVLDEVELILLGRRGPLGAVLDFIEGLQKLVPYVHPACKVAINEAFDRMHDAADDRAVVDKEAAYISRRVLQELRWDRERLDKTHGLKLCDCSLELAHSWQQSAAFAEGYEQLRAGLP